MTILDPPAGSALPDLQRLTDALDAAPADHTGGVPDGQIAPSGGIPPKAVDELLIATWNIKSLSKHDSKWTSQSGDSPRRDKRSLLYIATILERFDVIAVQELKNHTIAFREIVAWLNRNEPGRWRFVITDSSSGAAPIPTSVKNPGNFERLAYLYDTASLDFSGLAAELVIPWHRFEAGEDRAQEQFARAPYAVSFRSTLDPTVQFILLTVHVNYSAKAINAFEIREIARWVRDWGRKTWAWDTDIIALGDFNADRADNPNFQPFASRLHVPDAMNAFPRTIFNGGKDKHYDMITWLRSSPGSPDGPGPSIRFVDTGYFDFQPHVFTNLPNTTLAAQISDHYPLWARFAI